MAAEPSFGGMDATTRLLSVARSAVAELRGGDLYGLDVSLYSTLQNELGLDSLARVELLHRVEEAFQIRLPDDTFASAATLRDLLAVIERNRPGAAVPTERTAKNALRVTRPERTPDRASTLIEMLRWYVERDPSTTAITVITADGEQPITHATLWQTALAVCGGLQARGVIAGEAIARMLATGAEYFTAFMGVLLCGCVPVPIYPPAEAGQLEEQV